MGSCCSRLRKNDNAMWDEDFDSYYEGDQSWRFYQEESNFYVTEFTPKNQVRKKSSRFSIRSKIESIRKSFFNQGNQLNNVEMMEVEPKKKTSLAGLRRSWLGDGTPKRNKRLSAQEARIEYEESFSGRSLSRSSINRLCTTKQFVENHRELEDIRNKPIKSYGTPKRISFLDQLQPAQVVEETVVHKVSLTTPPRRLLEPPNIFVEEDEISISTVRKGDERDVMQKFQQLNNESSAREQTKEKVKSREKHEALLDAKENSEHEARITSEECLEDFIEQKYVFEEMEKDIMVQLVDNLEKESENKKDGERYDQYSEEIGCGDMEKRFTNRKIVMDKDLLQNGEKDERKRNSPRKSYFRKTEDNENHITNENASITNNHQSRNERVFYEYKNQSDEDLSQSSNDPNNLEDKQNNSIKSFSQSDEDLSQSSNDPNNLEDKQNNLIKSFSQSDEDLSQVCNDPNNLKAKQNNSIKRFSQSDENLSQFPRKNSSDSFSQSDNDGNQSQEELIARKGNTRIVADGYSQFKASRVKISNTTQERKTSGELNNTNSITVTSTGTIGRRNLTPKIAVKGKTYMYMQNAPK